MNFNAEAFGGGVLVTFRQGEGVNEGVNSLLLCIKQHPGLRIPDLSALLKVPPKTLERWLKRLRDEGIVVFRGPAKTGGYYVKLGMDFGF